MKKQEKHKQYRKLVLVCGKTSPGAPMAAGVFYSANTAVNKYFLSLMYLTMTAVPHNLLDFVLSP